MHEIGQIDSVRMALNECLKYGQEHLRALMLINGCDLTSHTEAIAHVEASVTIAYKIIDQLPEKMKDRYKKEFHHARDKINESMMFEMLETKLKGENYNG